MQTRKTFVGVDAHIDPYDARPFLRYAAANLRLPNGRTEASAPTGRFTLPPMVGALLQLHPVGESTASTPTEILGCRHTLYDFAGAFCAGGQAPPLRYDETGWCTKITGGAQPLPRVRFSQNAQLPFLKMGTVLPSSQSASMFISAVPIMKSSWIMESLTPSLRHSSSVLSA